MLNYAYHFSAGLILEATHYSCLEDTLLPQDYGHQHQASRQLSHLPTNQFCQPYTAETIISINDLAQASQAILILSHWPLSALFLISRPKKQDLEETNEFD